MGFAVELFLNEREGAVIREAFAALGSPMATIGASPHVSLAVFGDEVDCEGLVAATEQFAQATKPFTIRFSSIGVFPTEEAVLFLAPVVTSELLDLHRRLHDELTVRGIRGDPLYVPGAWVPHCTIAIEQPLTDSLERLQGLGPHSLLGEYLVDSVHVVEFRPVVTRAAFPLG